MLALVWGAMRFAPRLFAAELRPAWLGGTAEAAPERRAASVEAPS